jgi:polysaccharide pyruvyl transferase WcaK-like protein
VVFFDEDLLPTELRAVIAAGAVLLTSRFHAMISALTERTPLLVIGWSHKYAEVLAPFGLTDLAMAYADLTGAEAVLDRTEKLLARRDEVATTIGERLPDAVAAAEINFDALVAAVRR